MSTTSEIETGIESLASLIKEAETDPNVLERMIENPLQVLESIGMSVEEPFRDVVASHLKCHARIKKESKKSEEGVLTPLAARLEPPFKTIIQPWGIVLRCNPEGVKAIKIGKGVETAIWGAIAASSGAIPEAFSKSVTAISAGFAAFCVLQVGVIELVDRGKGVFITKTWLHYLVPGAGVIPIVTPIT